MEDDHDPGPQHHAAHAPQVPSCPLLVQEWKRNEPCLGAVILPYVNGRIRHSSSYRPTFRASCL